MRGVFVTLALIGLGAVATWGLRAKANEVGTKPITWPQWRGPGRDAHVGGDPWPARLSDGTLTLTWELPLGPSYSGPIVAEDLVFTTETKNKETEVVHALDRRTGKSRWRAEWPGAMTVPFFAASNGSWIRATPAYDGTNLYVAGMRDVLACLDARDGSIRWRVDFVQRFQAPLPAFGFVSSPLVEGDAIYVQAGASVVKLNKHTGEVAWRALHDEGGMNGSAFSSPVIAKLRGVRQLVVQTRTTLAGIDLETGNVLWSQTVPSFRGMNILTPTIHGDAIFTSSYQNKSWLYGVSREEDRFAVKELWNNAAHGYMSTPVVIDGHAYLHLQNQRLACINLATGEQTWAATGFGKYLSMVAQADRILALDERGILFLIQANPKEYQQVDKLKVSDAETWAHLAVAGDELYVRRLNGLAAYRWRAPSVAQGQE